MFNVSIREYFSIVSVFVVCIRNTAMFKLIPLLCTHVYPYMFSTVHPPSVDGQHISIYRMRIYMKFFRFAFLLVVILQPCDSIEVRELLGLWGSSHSTLSIYKCWVQSMTDEMSSPQKHECGGMFFNVDVREVCLHATILFLPFNETSKFTSNLHPMWNLCLIKCAWQLLFTPQVTLNLKGQEGIDAYL